MTTEYINPRTVRAVRRAMLRGISLEDKYRLQQRTGCSLAEVEAAIEYVKRQHEEPRNLPAHWAPSVGGVR